MAYGKLCRAVACAITCAFAFALSWSAVAFADTSVSMHRLYNPNSGEHFYTADDTEQSYLVSVGWQYEGIGWIAPAAEDYPVYRLYNEFVGDHHYTLDDAERDYLVSVGWIDEGIGWYSAEEGMVPLYRQYNPNANTGSHNYTTSQNENDYLVSIGWKAEGVGWYALASGFFPQWMTQGVVGVKANVAGEDILSQAVGEAQYLFLPSGTDLSALSITGLSVKSVDMPLLLSADPDSDGVLVGVGEPFDVIGAVGDQGQEALDAGGDQEQETGYFTLWVRAQAGVDPFELRIMRSSGISSMFIDSENGEDYVDSSPDHSVSDSGTITVLGADGQAVLTQAELASVKGRGNSTWADPKRPYNIKLDKKADLLGTGEKTKKYSLLANAFDRSSMRNIVSLKLSKAVGITETPDCEFCDLWYDGRYRGTYLLCEKIGVWSGGVDIYDLESATEEANAGNPSYDNPVTATATNAYEREYQYVKGVNNPADYSHGYLVELDERYETDLCWFDSSFWHFVVKSPEVLSKEEMEYVSELFENALYGIREGDGKDADGNPIEDVLDIPSFARDGWLAVLDGDTDYMNVGSTYFFVTSDGVIHAGPSWDFDVSWINNYIIFDDQPVDYANDFERRVLNEADNALLKRTIAAVHTELFRPLIADTLLGDESAVDVSSGLRSVDAYNAHIADSVAMDSVLWSYDLGWRASEVERFKDILAARLQIYTDKAAPWATIGMDADVEYGVAAIGAK